MLYYSDAALRYAVDRCLEKDGYIVGIATKNKNDIIEKLFSIEKEYWESLSEDKQNKLMDTLKARSKINLFEIVFENGSCIRYIPISDCSRGYALNLLIVDEDVDDDTLMEVLIPLEKIEWAKRQQKRNNI